MTNRRSLPKAQTHEARHPGGSFRKQLDELIRGMRRRRSTSLDGDERPVGFRTSATRTEELHRMFDTLRLTLGFKIESPHGLKDKHAQSLVDYWVKEGYAASTIENRLSHLRVFATLALGKKGMIGGTDDYAPGLKRERIARQDKSVTAVTDPTELLLKALRFCPHVGTQLWVQWAFNLRPQEAICLKPVHADQVTYLSILDGTKGGRSRERQIEHPFQRQALDAARILAKSNPKGYITQRGLTLAQAKRRFYYVCEKIGFTRDILGATPHGLRHDALQWEFKIATGVDAPVKAVAPDAAPGKTILDISAEELERQQFRISNLAGHNRKASAGAYLGSIPAARRAAMKRKPLPEIDPHPPEAPLNERMAQMAKKSGHLATAVARDAVMQMARAHFSGDSTRDSIPFPGAEPKASAPAAAPEPAATNSSAEGMPAPAVKESPASAAPSRTSRAAQPQRPGRDISAAPAREAKPAKANLVARLFGKINPDEQMPTPRQDDLFSAPPATPQDSSPGKAGPDERDPYAKPGDWH